MNYPTPPLENMLLLMAVVFPTGFGANITALLSAKPQRSLAGSLVGMIVAYALLGAAAVWIAPQHALQFQWAVAPIYYMAAILAGGLCILLEYSVGVVLVSLRSRTLVTHMTVHSSYASASRVGLWDIATVLVFVIGEEWVLRQMLFSVLRDFGLQIGLVVALCTFVYALNHITFGPGSVVAKLPSGLVYTLLFYCSGLSIIIPIVAHGTQNLGLLMLARSRGAR
jgi:hypothetical protein